MKQYDIEHWIDRIETYLIVKKELNEEILSARFTSRDLRELLIMLKNLRDLEEWRPIEEPPETDDYILLSFSNDRTLEVGWFEMDDNGDGAYYLKKTNRKALQTGLIVNGWMPLPKSKED